jgi:excisionase family DNA binding protein
LTSACGYPMHRRSFLTTFEISQICEVNPTTVQNWVKENKLKAFVTPGGHRRVRREHLVSFMKEFGMPVPPELQQDGHYVLIVDDDASMRDLLHSIMSVGNEGIEIAAAPGGVEALLMIGERKPELLILDIMMPGMNGFDVCRKLKSNKSTAQIKIVAISGVHDTALPEQMLKAGADLFFTKPLDVAEFRQKCLKLIS